MPPTARRKSIRIQAARPAGCCGLTPTVPGDFARPGTSLFAASSNKWVRSERKQNPTPGRNNYPGKSAARPASGLQGPINANVPQVYGERTPCNPPAGGQFLDQPDHQFHRFKNAGQNGAEGEDEVRQAQ